MKRTSYDACVKVLSLFKQLRQRLSENVEILKNMSPLCKYASINEGLLFNM